MANQIDEYEFGPHLQERIDDKQILLSDIQTVIQNENVLKIRGKNGATKFILNRTRISRSLDTNTSQDRLILKRLYKEGGLTVVLNEATKFIITAY